MKIDEILDLMDQLLDHAKPIPFASHKVIVDGTGSGNADQGTGCL